MKRFSYQLSLVFGRTCGVAIRVQEHLRVCMDGDEGLDVAMGLHKVHNGLDLRFRMSTGTMVGL